MISVLNNRDGFVLGYIEWDIIDLKMNLTPSGEYIYIGDIWIHQDFRNGHALKSLIKLAYDHEFTRRCKWVYWVRHKYNDRKKIFLIKRFGRELNGK